MLLMQYLFLWSNLDRAKSCGVGPQNTAATKANHRCFDCLRSPVAHYLELFRIQ